METENKSIKANTESNNNRAIQSVSGPSESNDFQQIQHSQPDVVPISVVEAENDSNSTYGGTWLCCLICYWFKRNNSVSKFAHTMAMLIVTSLLVTSPVLFLISSIPGSETEKDCFYHSHDGCSYDRDGAVTECQNIACKSIAARVKGVIDDHVSPCKDFYKFACGSVDKYVTSNNYDELLDLNQMQNNVFLEIQSLLYMNATNWPFQKLGIFFKSCLDVPVNTNNISYEFLEELGGYLPPGSVGPSDLTSLIVKLLKHSCTQLFDIYLDRNYNTWQTNESHPPRLAAYINVPFHFLSTGYTANYNAYYNEIKDYKENMDELRKMLINLLPKKMDENQKEKELQNILLFITLLNEIRESVQTDDNVALDSYVNYRTYNMTQLQFEFSYVNWDQLLREVFSINFTESDVVYVMSPQYLIKIEELVTRFHKRIIHNSLLLTCAQSIVNKFVRGPHLKQNWAFYCTKITAELFSRPVAALYLRQFPPYYLRHVADKISTMFLTLKKTFTERMKIISWIDNKTRDIAVKKLKSLRGQFLAWPMLFNLTYISKTLQNVELDSTNFFQNVISRYRQLRSTNLDSVMELPVEKAWAYPYIVNIFYEARNNIIVVPLAILTQSYFRDDIPDYITYGTVGNLFAHELLHGFDLDGIGYELNQTKRNWFTVESRLSLEARLECIQKQYGNVFKKTFPLKKQRHDSETVWIPVKNEYMADIAGCQIAYDAWRSTRESKDTFVGSQLLPGMKYTPRQLFYITINGIMMNTPAFSEAFSCSLESPMNPSKKCSTW